MRERDLSSWSFALPWHPWGVSVRVHVLFPCVVAGVMLRVATAREYDHSLWWESGAIALILFLSVLWHEIGHLVAARRLNGDLPQVILWPFGSLAFADVPQTPRNHSWVALGGLIASLGVALAAGGALLSLGFVPPLNPVHSSLTPRLKNWRDGRIYTSRTNPGDAEYFYFSDPEDPQRWSSPVKLTFAITEDGQRYLAHQSEPVELVRERHRSVWRLKGTPIELEPARLTAGPIWLSRLFLMNWLLFCVNLLPALPLDGGRLLQAWLGHRGERHNGGATTAYVGFLVMLGLGVYSIVLNDLLPAILAVVVYLCSRQELNRIEQELADESAAGVGQEMDGDVEGSEDETSETLGAPRMSWWQRFWHERNERRRLREIAQRQAEERRLDELLDKILRHGRSSLTEEEVRFLTRISSRYSANNRTTRDSHA